MPDFDALVIGAGLAGSSSAWSLAQRGLNVLVLERHAEAADEASGNLAGIYMPVLEAMPSLKEAFYLDALRLLQGRLAAASDRIIHQACGVVHLPRDEKQRQRFQRIVDRDDLAQETVRLLSAQEAKLICGVPISEDGLYYPGGGWVSPRSLCRYYLDHPRITLITHQDVKKLNRHDHVWQALDKKGKIIASSDIAIIAGGHFSKDLEQTDWLPFHKVRGQVTQLSLQAAHGLRAVICHQGYVLPLQDQKLIIGATYTRDRCDYEPDMAEHDENIRMLHQFLPEFANSLEIHPEYHGRVGFRSVVPGRLPLAGRLLPAQRLRHKQTPVMYKKLAISAAHASRGILSSGIAGEMIAGELLEEASNYSHYKELLSPVRFLRHI